jgi:signal transduction histidine kinase
LQKPIDARSFAATVRGYLDGRREQVSPDQTGKHLRLQSQRIAAHLEEKIEELSAANERLTELDQARKQFYRNVSHELSTPMTPIVGYVKLLVDGELGPISPAQAKALRAMQECVGRLRGLIDNLLDVTAIETGKLHFSHAEYDFSEVVASAVARKSAAFEEAGLSLVTELPPSLRGHGDAIRLGNAIEHMLDNAVKFTPAGGSVGVRARRMPSGHFELTVADTGPGVSGPSAVRLFEPFYQVDGSPTRAHGGAGVGLAIVRGVARGHAGDARVVSPCDERIGGARLGGSAFYFLVSERAVAASGLGRG